MVRLIALLAALCCSSAVAGEIDLRRWEPMSQGRLLVSDLSSAVPLIWLLAAAILDHGNGLPEREHDDHATSAA